MRGGARESVLVGGQPFDASLPSRLGAGAGGAVARDTDEDGRAVLVAGAQRQGERETSASLAHADRRVIATGAQASSADDQPSEPESDQRALVVVKQSLGRGVRRDHRPIGVEDQEPIGHGGDQGLRPQLSGSGDVRPYVECRLVGFKLKCRKKSYQGGFLRAQFETSSLP